MKYTVSIEIALPRERVAQLLADPAHMPKWLRGLVLHEPISGEHGQVGTKSRVVMQMGNQKMEATETITRREPADLREIPKETVVHFEREIVGKGMWNAARERLIETSPETTLWESENEYRFDSLLMRLVALMMPGPSASNRYNTCRTSRRSPSRERTSAKPRTDMFADSGQTARQCSSQARS